MISPGLIAIVLAMHGSILLGTGFMAIRERFQDAGRDDRNR